MSKITVVGSFVTDMVATMSRFPQAGETVIGERLRIYPGGKGANQCVANRFLWSACSGTTKTEEISARFLKKRG